MTDSSQVCRQRDAVWVPMRDHHGEILPGIRARGGVSTPSEAGLSLGADVIEMQPPAAFPLHVHDGSHVLYIIQGSGWVEIGGGERYAVAAGDSTFIPFKRPHRMGCDAVGSSTEPFVFFVVSYPHYAVDGMDRLTVLAEA